MAEERTLTKSTGKEDIYDGSIKDVGITTNDPIARQLITMGTGR
jgi:hypothetical protein